MSEEKKTNSPKTSDQIQVRMEGSYEAPPPIIVSQNIGAIEGGIVQNIQQVVAKPGGSSNADVTPDFPEGSVTSVDTAHVPAATAKPAAAPKDLDKKIESNEVAPKLPKAKKLTERLKELKGKPEELRKFLEKLQGDRVYHDNKKTGKREYVALEVGTSTETGQWEVKLVTFDAQGKKKEEKTVDHPEKITVREWKKVPEKTLGVATQVRYKTRNGQVVMAAVLKEENGNYTLGYPEQGEGRRTWTISRDDLRMCSDDEGTATYTRTQPPRSKPKASTDAPSKTPLAPAPDGNATTEANADATGVEAGEETSEEGDSSPERRAEDSENNTEGGETAEDETEEEAANSEEGNAEILRDLDKASPKQLDDIIKAAKILRAQKRPGILQRVKNGWNKFWGGARNVFRQKVDRATTAAGIGGAGTGALIGSFGGPLGSLLGGIGGGLLGTGIGLMRQGWKERRQRQGKVQGGEGEGEGESGEEEEEEAASPVKKKVGTVPEASSKATLPAAPEKSNGNGDRVRIEEIPQNGLTVLADIEDIKNWRNVIKRGEEFSVKEMPVRTKDGKRYIVKNMRARVIDKTDDAITLGNCRGEVDGKPWSTKGTLSIKLNAPVENPAASSTSRGEEGAILPHVDWTAATGTESAAVSNIAEPIRKKRQRAARAQAEQENSIAAEKAARKVADDKVAQENATFEKQIQAGMDASRARGVVREDLAVAVTGFSEAPKQVKQRKAQEEAAKKLRAEEARRQQVKEEEDAAVGAIVRPIEKKTLPPRRNKHDRSPGVNFLAVQKKEEADAAAKEAEEKEAQREQVRKNAPEITEQILNDTKQLNTFVQKNGNQGWYRITQSETTYFGKLAINTFADSEAPGQVTVQNGEIILQNAEVIDSNGKVDKKKTAEMVSGREKRLTVKT